MNLPAIIRQRLAQFDRRRRSTVTARGLAEALLVLGAGLGIIVLAEWLFRPGLKGRAWLSASIYFATLGWLLVRAGGPWLRHQPLRRIARLYEDAAHGRFQERVLSAVEMAESPPPGVSGWMV